MSKARSTLAVLGTAALLALVVGGPAAAASHSVSAINYQFQPATITVTVGDSVTWTNATTDTPHTSTADGGAWDSGTINPGQSFTHTFSSAGTFAYHCTFHVSLGMVGTVVVQSGSGGGGTTTAPVGGSPLPNTGSSPMTGPFLVLGLLFLLTGAFVLYRLRRVRRA